MPNANQALGAWGERVALKYLLNLGDRLLARNVRTPFGELDIITHRNTTTVFIEVKTRRTARFGLPEESITHAKQTHLLRSATAYLADHPEYDGDWQIDVIAVRSTPGLEPEITHFENALTG